MDLPSSVDFPQSRIPRARLSIFLAMAYFFYLDMKNKTQRQSVGHQYSKLSFSCNKITFKIPGKTKFEFSQ